MQKVIKLLNITGLAIADHVRCARGIHWEPKSEEILIFVCLQSEFKRRCILLINLGVNYENVYNCTIEPNGGTSLLDITVGTNKHKKIS